MYCPKAETELQRSEESAREWRPVAYFIRCITAAEQMYQSYELAVVEPIG